MRTFLTKIAVAFLLVIAVIGVVNRTRYDTFTVGSARPPGEWQRWERDRWTGRTWYKESYYSYLSGKSPWYLKEPWITVGGFWRGFTGYWEESERWANEVKSTSTAEEELLLQLH